MISLSTKRSEFEMGVHRHFTNGTVLPFPENNDQAEYIRICLHEVDAKSKLESEKARLEVEKDRLAIENNKIAVEKLKLGVMSTIVVMALITLGSLYKGGEALKAVSLQYKEYFAEVTMSLLKSIEKHAIPIVASISVIFAGALVVAAENISKGTKGLVFAFIKIFRRK
jgi:hypothetical protein